ncbi:MAG: succinylglutamate desuccinylase [Deltaproteobacteria bacterium]|nr:succinylglutamate desuccinylase [Deltaproteobacteria bacterium]
MFKKMLRVLMATLALVLALTSMAAADKLLCISKQELKGEMTVAECVAKGEQFAVMDDKGVVRILSPKEIDLMRQTNPNLFEMKAFGMRHRELAPEIPKLPPLAVPKTGAM